MIFSDINIQFTEGNIYRIVGDNGTGKSVLLKLISGLSRADSGKIIVDEREVGKNGNIIINAGISINQPEFYPFYSGKQNLEYLLKINNTYDVDYLNLLIQELDLTDSLKKLYKTYSLGMRQKLRFIQAIVEKPKYLLLDEPFNAVDSKGKKSMCDFLVEFMREDPQRVIIYTSHNNEEIQGIDETVIEVSELNLKSVA